jgi:epoxyqueuosine reductase
VRSAALRLGFDAVRFTTPDPPGHAGQMAAFLRAGLHGEMGYLERRAALRAGPLDSSDLLAGALSVVVLAVSYDLPDRAPTGHAAHGTIARYARGDDYHDILRPRLNALGDYLAGRWPGTRSRGFVDSGPIRERELAARAGLGWQGKHTGLISLDLGNWFFLAALLTTLPLAPDPPLASGHCGTCTRCLSACPTAALIAPQTLDARRCISYLTIELKGAIPLDLRPLMGDRIFGCDDCLAACPWNERAQAGREMRLAARDAEAAHPDLLPLLELLADDAAFKERFRGTPLLRPGRAGLRRNVCVALGNVGRTEAVPALEAVFTDDPSEMVREHAAWAIQRIGERPRRSPAV